MFGTVFQYIQHKFSCIFMKPFLVRSQDDIIQLVLIIDRHRRPRSESELGESLAVIYDHGEVTITDY